MLLAQASTYLVLREVIQARLLLLFNDGCEPRLQKLGVLAFGSKEERRDLFMIFVRGEGELWLLGVVMVRHDSILEEPRLEIEEVGVRLLKYTSELLRIVSRRIESPCDGLQWYIQDPTM